MRDATDGKETVTSGDDDIQFDFFDEPATTESSSSRVRLPQRGSRGGAGSGGRDHARPPHDPAPFLRLVLLVGFVVFLAVILALGVQSCTSQSRHAAYAAYVAKVSDIARQSTDDGKKLEAALTTSSATASLIAGKLTGIVDREKQNIEVARRLTVPGRLRAEQASLIEALELRVSGVSGLAKALQSQTKVPETDQAKALAEQARRLLASDIVWADLFQSRLTAQLGQDGVTGVSPPESVFLANPEQIATQDAMLQIVRRINGGGGGSTTTTTGLHGTNLVSVVALPKGAGGATETLTAGSLNTVTTSTSLAFQVTIRNGGDFQEVQVPVELQITRGQAGGSPITKDEKVQVIDPGQTAVVDFTGLNDVSFGQQTTLTVTVGKVPGETNGNNNSATYTVIFALPG